MGYFAVVILIVWNYNAKFFVPLQMYSLYSAFVCLQAVINSQIEKTLAVIIIALAKLIQMIVCYTLQPILTQAFTKVSQVEDIAAITLS